MTQILEQRELNTRELVLEGGMSAEEEAGLLLKSVSWKLSRRPEFSSLGTACFHASTVPSGK